MKNLLRTGFERRILWKMSNRHAYYNKGISWSRQLFPKTGIARESVRLRTLDRKLTLNLVVIFNSFTDISSLKYNWNILWLLLFSGKKIGSTLKCSSQCLCLCLFYQVKEQSVARKIFYWSCGPGMYSQQYFSGNLQKF